MKIDILSLFPDFISSIKNYSMIKRAIDNNILEIGSIDIRDYSKDKHKKVDDYSYGGGPGMVMTPQPIVDALKDNSQDETYVILTSPRGQVLDHKIAKDLAEKEHLVIICGHYEGVDQRVIDKYVDKEVSIGDYILTGGEIASMVIVDSLVRFIPDVLGNSESHEIESFSMGLLEYDQYTRPQEFEGMQVPEVLLSGDHKKIEEFRHISSINITKERRPDLLVKYNNQIKNREV